MPRAKVTPLGNIVAERRAERGLTQEELAKTAGYSKRTVERIESGQVTTMSTLVDIAHALKCSPDELVNFTGSEETTIVPRVRNWLELQEEKKRLNDRINNAVLQDLISTADDAVPLTFRTLSKSFRHNVKGTATVGELAVAIGREYFQEERKTKQMYFCDSDGDEYPIGLTALELKEQLVSDLHIYLRDRVSGPAAVIISLIPRMAKFVRQLSKGRFFPLWIWCRFVVLLYRLPILRNTQPPSFILGQLNKLLCIYTEANVCLNRADILASMIEKSPLSNHVAIRDSISWLWYRRGWYKAAYLLLTRDTPDEALSHVGVMYHLYFIAQKAGDVGTSNAVRDWFIEKFPELEWSKSLPRLSGGSLDFYINELECRRVRMDDDSLMPDENWM